jgi:hypothetical protein
MHAYYTYLALDIANRRTAEANAERLAALAYPQPSRITVARRMIARIAVAIARAADEDLRVSLSAR